MKHFFFSMARPWSFNIFNIWWLKIDKFLFSFFFFDWFEWANLSTKFCSMKDNCILCVYYKLLFSDMNSVFIFDLDVHLIIFLFCFSFLLSSLFFFFLVVVVVVVVMNYRWNVSTEILDSFFLVGIFFCFFFTKCLIYLYIYNNNNNNNDDDDDDDEPGFFSSFSFFIFIYPGFGYQMFWCRLSGFIGHYYYYYRY